MSLKYRNYLNIFWLLIKTDLVILRQFFVGQLINILIWSGSIVVIAAFIFPKLGMTDKFGEFMAISSIIANSFWGIWDSAYRILEDIEGEKTIDYALTLPMPSWLVIFQQAFKHFIVKILPSLFILPVFKFLLGNKMDLSHFSLFKFLFILITINLFTGFFFLFISSFIKNSHKVENIGMRLLFPMWFFGATEYSWNILFEVNTRIGYLALLNPLVYAMEGIHAAVSGQTGYLSFWLCVAVLWVFIFACGFLGVYRFKKRLDFV